MTITEKELEQLISESIVKQIYLNEPKQINEETLNEWIGAVAKAVSAIAKPLLKNVAKQGMKYLVKNGMKSAGKQIMKGGFKNVAQGVGNIAKKTLSDPKNFSKAVNTVTSVFGNNNQGGQQSQSSQYEGGDQNSEINSALGDTSEMERAINQIQSDTSQASIFSDTSNSTTESNNWFLDKNYTSLNEEQLRGIIKDIVFETIISVNNSNKIL